ncbi:MAG: nitrate/nitrite transporter NrtS [Acidimicrobiia bacterium]
MAERAPRAAAVVWDSYRQAAAMFFRGATVSSASRIALVVGTWLSLVNQGEAVFDGRPPWLKIVLNYATPFVVASLGFLAGRRRRNIERLTRLLGDEPPAPST